MTGEMGGEREENERFRLDRSFGDNVGDGVPERCPEDTVLECIETPETDIVLVTFNDIDRAWGSLTPRRIKQLRTQRQKSGLLHLPRLRQIVRHMIKGNREFSGISVGSRKIL